MPRAHRSPRPARQPDGGARALPHGAGAGDDPLRAAGLRCRERRSRQSYGDGGPHAYLAGLPLVARGLAQVRPAVVVLAHTASSYANGFANEPALVERLAALPGAPAVTAAGAVRAALQHLGAKRLALGTPYQESVSRQSKVYWQAAGFEIVGDRRLGDVGSIYDETEERAYELARQADTAEADAVLLSGTGLPTIGVLERLEHDLGKPVVSSVQACLWQALRVAGRPQPIEGFGRLLRDVAR